MPELETARQQVATYKDIRPLVAGGDLYRLASPREGAFSALMYVAKDKSEAVLFAYRLLPNRPLRNPFIRLAGLDLEATYTVDGDDRRLTGKAWAEVGFRVEIGDLQSKILRIKRA